MKVVIKKEHVLWATLAAREVLEERVYKKYFPEYAKWIEKKNGWIKFLNKFWFTRTPPIPVLAKGEETFREFNEKWVKHYKEYCYTGSLSDALSYATDTKNPLNCGWGTRETLESMEDAAKNKFVEILELTDEQYYVIKDFFKS